MNRVDSHKGLDKMPELQLTKELMEKVGYSNKTNTKLKNKYVVTNWLNPKECPILKNGWEVKFEDILPGEDEVIKVWNLKNGDEVIDIRLFVSSQGNHFSLNRFFALGSYISLPQSPFEKGPDYLGHYSAMSKFTENSIYFWVYHNVVFDVRTQNTTFNIDELLKWLMSSASSNLKDNLDNYLPSIDSMDLSLFDKKLLIDINADKHFLVQYVSDDKSDNNVKVIVVDKNTLLSNSKKINFRME